MNHRFDWIDPSKGWLDKELTPNAVNAIKGVLIVLVVVGHSRWDHEVYRLVKSIIYNFHAVLFLLLPFMFAVNPLTWDRFKTLLRRYYVPLVWFVLAAFLLKNFILDAPPGISSTEAVELISALLSGTGSAFNSTVELELFWFLPALFGLFIWRSIWPYLPLFVKIAVGFLGTYVFLFSMAIPQVRLLPTILTISLYVFILGPLTFSLINMIYRLSGRRSFWIGLLGFLVLCCYAAATGRGYNIAKINLPGLDDPLGIGVYIGNIAFAFVAIEGLCSFEFVQSVFRRVGKMSLGIYLVHMFMIVGFDLVLPRLFPPTDFINVGSIVCALLGSVIVVMIIDVVPNLKGVIFPR